MYNMKNVLYNIKNKNMYMNQLGPMLEKRKL